MEYKTTEQFNKRFLIDLGLRPGYEENETPFSVEDIKEWYMRWQKDRAEKNEPYFAGIITSTNFVYAFKDGEEVKGMHEPSVRIEGEITKEYHGAIFDNEEECLKVIFDLAKMLGANAKQERVHVFFNDRSFVLDGN
jgi:hypothetical protein